MGNVNCDLAGLFQGCCDENENSKEDETECYESCNNTAQKNGTGTATADAGGDVVCGGNIGSTVITNQNNTGISAGIMNVKGNINQTSGTNVPVVQNCYLPSTPNTQGMTAIQAS